MAIGGRPSDNCIISLGYAILQYPAGSCWPSGDVTCFCSLGAKIVVRRAKAARSSSLPGLSQPVSEWPTFCCGLWPLMNPGCTSTSQRQKLKAVDGKDTMKLHLLKLLLYTVGIPSAGKRMATVFWDHWGIILFEWLPEVPSTMTTTLVACISSKNQ